MPRIHDMPLPGSAHRFTWLLAVACLGQFAALAQLDLETAVPTNWTAAAGSLSISSNHYKLGLQSLQWNYGTNDSLTVTNPGITAADVTDYYKHTCDLWVHNPTNLPGQKLVFQFVDSSGTAQYYFDFYLNYTGWRRAVRSYIYDMKGPKSSASFNRVRIVGPTNTASGRLCFDAVTWVGPRFTRQKDPPNLDVSGYYSVSNFHHVYYDLPPDIPTNAPNPAELADLATLRAAWLVNNAGSVPSASALTSAYTAWTNMSIVTNGLDIRGGLITQDTAALESWVVTLGKDVYWRTNADSANKLKLFLRHWFDQGMDYGSGEAQAGGSGGYDFRQTPNGFILGYPAYDAALKQHVWQMLLWMYRMGSYWTTKWTPGLTAGGTDDYVYTDDVYLNIRRELGAILFLSPDDATAVQYLKGLKRFVERYVTPTQGTYDHLKVDGCGFHHSTHYNAYMYAEGELSEVLYLLKGTAFQVNSNAYVNLRGGLFAMLRMANAESSGSSYASYTANSLCGRHPFTASLPFSYTTLQHLGEWGGGALGGLAVDPVVAQAYNRLFGTTHPYAPFTSYGSEPNPTGFYQFNYSPIGVYRQSNWVATLHGMNNVFWGSEIYATENRYGRYQSYGACEVLYPGGIGASGFSLTGWDWNRPPGATTIALPWAQLVAESDREDVRSALNFSGALSFHGQSGLYACNFQEVAAGTNHTATFVWRKSWFCFSNQVVCLGSNISNTNTANPTVTTLFQGLLPTTATATVLNGTNITTFPYSLTNTATSNRWLLDACGTGYLLRPGTPLRLTRSLQSSPSENTSGTTSSTNYATAWLDHGTAPANASYEYVVVPATTAAAMSLLTSSYTNAAMAPHEVLQQDATAHVAFWKADGRIGYALFSTGALASAVTNASPLRSVTRPCLLMTQPNTNGMLWLTLTDPNLNLVNNVSTRTNHDLTLAGRWWVGSGPTTASVLNRTTNSTTLRLQTVDGLPVEVLLQTNSPLTISSVADQTISRNGATSPLAVTVADGIKAPETLSLTATSSNTALVAATNIVLGGTGSARTVTVTPKPNATGSALITLTVSDGMDSTSTAFTVTVFDPGAVVLRMVPSAGGAVLTWPGDIGSWSLHSATNLVPPVAWSPSLATPIFTNQQWMVPIFSGAGSPRFYRLQLP
jgi:chondroitin-sulfate-ABC endolyase/exolyase